MNTAIWAVSFLIIATKFLDCYTTAKQIRSIAQEQNPLPGFLMRKFGARTAIWTIFVLSILIVFASVSMLGQLGDGHLHKWFYIIIGLLIAAAQFAVAHSNHTKRVNPFTKALLKVFKMLRGMRF